MAQSTFPSAEQRWLDGFRQGDPQALEALYTLYAQRVYRLAFRLTGNSADAEEIASEAFLRAFRNAGELREANAFRTWLFRITRNLALDRLRQPRLLNLSALGEEMEAEESDLALQMSVRQALESLPLDYREALLLIDVEGLSAKEAASLLEITIPSLKARLHRARRALRDLLTEDNEEP